MRLTEAQRRALKLLEVLPVEILYWGGKPHCGMPHGIRTTATLFALLKSKMVAREYSGLREHWSITAEGRAALAQSVEKK